ncbi:MAG TPA: c-type cytochrome [Usitatibacter sp.]|jgi:sulfur-oxidizing protein SoxX|nr:c-type cytochrome [Usitatibacter sp.]
MRPHFAIVAAAGVAFAPAVLAQKDQGLELFIRPDKGYCIACHQVPVQAGPATRSNVGPALAGPRMRELGSAALHELLRDPTRANPDTIMPPFGKHLLLDEREIDRLTEYLLALP